MKELVSIYEHIEESIKKNGTLDSTFNLDDYIDVKDEPILEPGLRDGLIYFTGESRPNERFLKLFKEIILNLDEETLMEDLERVDKYFSTKAAREDRLLYSVEYVYSMFERELDNINEPLFYKFATLLMTKSKKVEAVKLGIAMMGTTELESADFAIEILMKLALCEEFTFYVNIVLNEYQDANKIRFILAKKTSGWGKIFLVKDLIAEDENIKEWLITSGADNVISYARIAYDVAEKINILKVLKRDKLTEDEFSGICKIVEGLLINNLDMTIDKIYPKTYLDILTAFLEKLESFKYNIEFLRIALIITTFLTMKQSNTEPEINMIIYISNFFSEGEVFAVMQESIKNGNIEDVIICTSILSYYGNLELYDDIYARFKEAPFKYCFCLNYLMRRKDSRDKVIKLLENDIEDSKVTEDICPILTYTDEYYEDLKNAIYVLYPYPFKGENIIVAGLKCRAMGPRNTALSILEDWKEDTKCKVEDFPQAIKDALHVLKEKEVIKDFKIRINNLLDIEEDLSEYKEPKIVYLTQRVVNIIGDIDSLFEEKIIIKGQDYFTGHMVYSCLKTENKYTAYVQGSSFRTEYEVNIFTDSQGNIEKMRCSCPYERNCKHEYSTLKYIRSKYYKIDEE